MSKQILIVDDDTLLRRSLAFNLEQAGYSTRTAGSAEDALAMAAREAPDIILLDIGLPGMDGLQALKEFQKNLVSPVIFISARRRELDQVLGLELGADDYVTKPFNLDVLLARIKAVLRRASHQPPTEDRRQPLQTGDLFLDSEKHTANLAGKELTLTPREFNLLHALALEAGRVISTDELLNRVWGAEFSGQPQVLYVHIRWLREKIETDPDHPKRIVTVRGVGYKLILME